MKLCQKLLSFVLCTAMLCTLLPSLGYKAQAEAVTYAVEGGNLYFDPATGTVTDCDSAVTEAEIPETIAGVTVVAIGDSAFSYCYELTSVTLPHTVCRIGKRAFFYCHELTSIVIPGGVTEILSETFNECYSLLEITIPESLKSVGWYAFYGCGVHEVYYHGTKLKWSAVKLSAGNVELKTANFHYLQTEEDNPFTDVKESAYYGIPVLWAVYNGITTGMSTDRFAPEETCTRAQIVTFLWRASGSPEPKKNTNPFTDVSSKAYYYKAVLWAVENYITTGVGKDKFDPDGVCTRGQVATFLYRHRGTAIAPGAPNPFSDVKAGDYCYDGVRWAAKHNIALGIGEGRFAPELSCTRGQIVTFLYRYLYEYMGSFR